MSDAALTLLGALAALPCLAWLARRLSLRLRALRRLERQLLPTLPPEPSRLTRWLGRAGYRRPGAARWFLAASAGGLGLALLPVLGLRASGLLQQGEALLVELPGGLGSLLAPVLVAAPALLVLAGALVPYLVVNAARRRRVQRVEHDLPLTLELLATLGQAGLAFDAAVARILDARPADRPLFAELAAYQRDLRAGTPRVRALRTLSDRLQVDGVSILVSALVQAEQLGASLAETLRRQAEDLRQRRRAEVLVRSEALTVKLVFPLVICFMPGLFVFTLGPAFHQLFQITESFTHNRGR